MQENRYTKIYEQVKRRAGSETYANKTPEKTYWNVGLLIPSSEKLNVRVLHELNSAGIQVVPA